MKFTKLITIFSTITLLVGCSTANESKEQDNENTEIINTSETTGEEYPIIVEHAFGETTIKSKPEKVATVGWGNQDVALALGVTPVGMPKANWGPIDENGLLPWTAEALNILDDEFPIMYDETDGVDFEAIASAEPDIIIASYSGIVKEDYDLLSEIAPVIAYSEQPWTTLWREQVLLSAKGMGLEEEGISLVEDTEALIKEKVSAYPEFEGKKAMFAWISVADTSSFSVYTPLDPRAAYLVDLGFDFPESVYDLTEDTNSFFIDISSEFAAQLNDVDVLVLYGDKSMLEVLQNDPLLSAIPAIKNGAVVFLEDGSNLSGASTQTVLSIPYTIDEYLELFSEVVSKINE